MARNWRVSPANCATAALRRINVSMDTLDAAKFRAITRWGELDKVLAGIEGCAIGGPRGQDQRGGAEEPERG